jgi:heme exporter protein B
MSIQTRSRDVLLPVLLLPLSLPLVLPAAMAVSAYMFPELPSWGEVQSAVYLVILYDLLMVTMGLFFYHYVVES